MSDDLLSVLSRALDKCNVDAVALEKRAAELLSNNARHMLFELCEPDFAWGHPEHNYMTLDPWQDRDAKLELVDATMIEYGEPTGMDGLGGRTLTITRWGRAVSAHCLPLLLEARKTQAALAPATVPLESRTHPDKTRDESGSAQ